MKRINYKSDFDFILHLKDCKDPEKAVPFPECDFDARFWTSNKANAYTTSSKDGVYINCFRTDDGGMHFVFDNHRLGVGTLKWEPHFEHPNDIYPDNIQDLFSKEPLDIELVDGPGDCPTSAEVEIVAPFIKGDKGDKLTYSDLTEADKADLISPIKDDIDKAITEKADRTELSNVIGDITSFEDDGQFEAVTGFARADLKLDLFIDLFNAAAGSNGRYDPEHAPDKEHVFLLNELWLTYEEAVAVMDWGAITTYSTLARYKGAKIRTNLPPRVGATSDANTTTAFDLKYFDYGSDIEILNLACEPQVGNFGFVVAPQGGGWDYGLSGSKLRKVLGIVNLGKLTSTWNDMLWTPKLEEIRISHLKVNFSFRKCPLISAASLRYLIGERSGTNAITVTLHADTYAKLISAVDDPEDEWYGLIDLAAAKQITFACA